MKFKHKVVNYYHLEESKSIIDGKKKGQILSKIDKKFEDTFNLLKDNKSDEIDSVKIKDNTYYICAMDKGYSKDPDNGKSFAWLISISRLDPNKKVEVGDMAQKKVDKRNRPIKINPSEGLVVETQFLYDPVTHVFATIRTTGGMNIQLLKSFLLKFCDVRGITFAIIPDKDGLKDINNMVAGSKVTYKIAQIDALKNLRDPNRSELADIEYAEEIGGREMEITIVAGEGNLNIKGVKNKLSFLFKHSEELHVKKLQAQIKNADGIEEPLDLIQHKFKTEGDLEFDNRITDKNVMEFLDTQYGQVYSSLANLLRTEN
ncbi:hypothetical protein [Lactobacillus sp. PV034]|uniref:hypothetical protein n=1 Tax=Lactobacillus sp. PV034 TaxID=2594495 RepID=UPI00223EAEE9|nr:hypothetical protein [Lactobacillus sp. PV034]QNQ80513.1 hypothetical protein FP432_02580 [Lactobacillus sp. PV034]